MTPYLLLKKAIEKKTQSKESLLKKTNVFFMADQLDENEYNELIEQINIIYSIV